MFTIGKIIKGEIIMREKNPTKNQDKELKEILSVCSDVYVGTKYTRTFMKAVMRVNKSSTDILEKMKQIGEKTSSVADELCLSIPLKPVFEGSEEQEYEVSVDELRYLIAKAILPYMEENELRYDSDKNDIELYVMGRIFMLSRYIYELAQRAVYCYSMNRNSILNQLLEIANASMVKLAEYWENYQYDIEEISHNFPLHIILDEVHKNGYTDLCNAIEIMLPEVVASFYFYFVDYKSLLCNFKDYAENEGFVNFLSEKSCNEILKLLNKECLYDVNRPLKEQLCEIEEKIRNIYWEISIARKYKKMY